MRSKPLFRSARLLGLYAVLTGALAGPAFALTLNVTGDTYTDTQSPLQQLGAAPVIQIGNLNGRNQTGYVRFDLTPLPKGATISQAFLRFYVNNAAMDVAAAAEGKLTTANIPPTVAAPAFPVAWDRQARPELKGPRVRPERQVLRRRRGQRAQLEPQGRPVLRARQDRQHLMPVLAPTRVLRSRVPGLRVPWDLYG